MQIYSDTDGVGTSVIVVVVVISNTTTAHRQA